MKIRLGLKQERGHADQRKLHKICPRHKRGKPTLKIHYFGRKEHSIFEKEKEDMISGYNDHTLNYRDMRVHIHRLSKNKENSASASKQVP